MKTEKEVLDALNVLKMYAKKMKVNVINVCYEMVRMIVP